MSTVSEPMAVRQRPAPRLVLPPVPPAPARAPLWTRLPWLLGLGLLTASLIGASQVLHSRQTEQQPPAKTTPDRPPAGNHGVVCLGSVAIEGTPPDGVVLAPLQQGEVTEVLVYDGQNVRKGDILLRVDDEAAQHDVVRAELGMRLAEAQLTEARQGAERYQIGLEGQQALVEVARSKMRAAEAQARNLERLSGTELDRPNDLASARETVVALKSGIAAEEARLREMQANRPDALIQQAELKVRLAREQMELAKLGLKKCVLVAPEDGTVLRVNIGKGNVVSGQMRTPPVQFAPARPRIIRAEVSQEFAHRVQEGMPALVEDFAIPDITWQGTVKSLAPAYLPRRNAGSDVFSMGGNESWVRECVIELAPTQNPPLPGQRVRARIAPRTP